MLISVHLPKTAGSSFALSLEEHYKSAILKDYADLPLHTPKIKRHIKAIAKNITPSLNKQKNIKCIHGHFMPLKYYRYTHSSNTKFITWMRDPIERLASHYYYVKRKNDRTHPLHRKILIENWSLEKFCLSPLFRNVYSQFLWGFPLSKFDFIGIVEDYQSDLNFFSKKILGKHTSLYQHKDNTNPNIKNLSYFSKTPDLKTQIMKYHRKDVLLYQKAIHMHGIRLNTLK